jgi:hypothetical protein
VGNICQSRYFSLGSEVRFYSHPVIPSKSGEINAKWSGLISYIVMDQNKIKTPLRDDRRMNHAGVMVTGEVASTTASLVSMCCVDSSHGQVEEDGLCWWAQILQSTTYYI